MYEVIVVVSFPCPNPCPVFRTLLLIVRCARCVRCIRWVRSCCFCLLHPFKRIQVDSVCLDDCLQCGGGFCLGHGVGGVVLAVYPLNLSHLPLFCTYCIAFSTAKRLNLVPICWGLHPAPKPNPVNHRPYFPSVFSFLVLLSLAVFSPPQPP